MVQHNIYLDYDIDPQEDEMRIEAESIALLPDLSVLEENSSSTSSLQSGVGNGIEGDEEEESEDDESS